MKKIENFIENLATIEWFSACGNESDEYIVVLSIFEAFDGWNKRTLDVWLPQTHRLEEKAVRFLSDEIIDVVFKAVSDAIHNDVWIGYESFIYRCKLAEETGLEQEILDFVKRDISWACIEYLLGDEAFFHELLGLYKKGRWGFSYAGDYPVGKFVIM